MQDDLSGLGGILLAVTARLVVEPRPQHPGALLIEDHPEGAARRIDVEGHERLPVAAGDVGGQRSREAPEAPMLHVENPQTVTGTQAESLRPC